MKRELLAFPAAVAALLTACGAPPEAPAGLDDSARYLFREFYGSDAVMGAGLTGMMDWLETDGASLIDASASADNASSFAVADLTSADVAHLGLPADGRDLGNANGIISLADIACSLDQLEGFFARADQKEVFEGTFEDYQRTYITDLAAFRNATASGRYRALKDDLDPTQPEFDPAAYGDLILQTTNHATTSQIGVTIDYDLFHHHRHGTFDIQGEPTNALLGLQWLPNGSQSTDSTVLMQNYSIDAYIDRGDGHALRVFALWMHVQSPLIGVDSPIWATTGVNQAIGTAERLDALCAGATIGE